MKTLDRAQLETLTGYRSGSAQARWVRDNLGLEPMMGADGRPRLTEYIVEQAALARRIGGVPAPAAGNVSSLPGPNWRRAA